MGDTCVTLSRSDASGLNLRSRHAQSKRLPALCATDLPGRLRNRKILFSEKRMGSNIAAR